MTVSQISAVGRWNHIAKKPVIYAQVREQKSYEDISDYTLHKILIIVSKNLIFARKSLVPCQWNEWLSWNSCSKPCGGGEQKRLRTIQVEGRNGGKTCRKKESTQKQKCHNWFCPGVCKNL